MNTQKTEQKLKQALAKMLPEVIGCYDSSPSGTLGWMTYYWTENENRVRDTELLHLCALVEKTLGNAQCPTQSQWCQYIIALQEICGEVPAIFATWQQRVTALAKVKGIEL